MNPATTPCNDHTGDNVGDPAYHFQPRGLAVTQNSARLYVTRFLSFTKLNGRQASNDGKEGVVWSCTVNTSGTSAATVLTSLTKIALAAASLGLPGGRARAGLPEPDAEHRDPRRQRLSAEHRRRAGRAAGLQRRYARLRQPDHSTSAAPRPMAAR